MVQSLLDGDPRPGLRGDRRRNRQASRMPQCLRELGCPYAQGGYFGRAEPITAYLGTEAGAGRAGTTKRYGHQRSDTVPLQAITSSEPIPGYRIRERIGAGGYGEVWTADAPGGLVKAIKFVYGFLNEDRASRELKALNRIKAVRHPFLLSLERIEVVDGQLLIVTELAEASLKERFDECRANGLPGIPRDELTALHARRRRRARLHE